MLGRILTPIGGFFSLASTPQSARTWICPERPNDTARAHRFRRRLGFSSPERKKSAALPSAQGRTSCSTKPRTEKCLICSTRSTKRCPLARWNAPSTSFRRTATGATLVTFTWNIKTMEGKQQVRDMLKARLADTKPSNWKIADGEDASETDGIIESWIQFERKSRVALATCA